MEHSIMLVQDNRLTLSRQDFTPIEKRCLYYIIKEVRRLYVNRDLREDDKPYQDLFSDMYLNLKPEHLRTLGDEAKDVYNALRKLRHRDIEMETEDTWINTGWILIAKHDKKADLYTVQVSKDLLPYLVELASQFTEYSLTVAIALKSTYSQRLYEMCCMYRNKGKFFLEVEKLRYMLKVEDLKTYDNTANIKRKILDVAQKELQALYENDQCDLYFTYRVKDMEKRKILSFWVQIHTKGDEKQKKAEFATIQAQIRRIMEICKAFVKNDEKFLKRLENALNFNPNIAQDILEKLNKKVNDYSKKEIPAIIRYVLREDFDIK